MSDAAKNSATRSKSLLYAWAALEEWDTDVTFSSVVELCGEEPLMIDGSVFGHAAFVREIGCGFEILMCMITGREWRRAEDGPVTSVWPTFYLRGRTFEGLLEVRAKQYLPSDTTGMSEQLLWAQKTIIEKGWDDV